LKQSNQKSKSKEQEYLAPPTLSDKVRRGEPLVAINMASHGLLCFVIPFLVFLIRNLWQLFRLISPGFPVSPLND
jgi:hypothetical protein